MFSENPHFEIATDFTSLPDRIRTSRESANLSPTELARLCDVSANTIRAAETPLKAGQLPATKICLVINISIATNTTFEYLVLGNAPVERAQAMLESRASSIYQQIKKLGHDFDLAWGAPRARK